MIANIKCLGKLILAIASSLLFLELCECKPDFGVEVIDGNGHVLNADTDKLAVEQQLSNEADLQTPKRRWSQFNSWGKRGWDQNFAAWGKRRWNNFASWGKRDLNEVPLQNFAQIDPEKRGWANFASWGKRADGDTSADGMDKRKWSSFHTWGKRNKENFQDQQSYDKKWSQFAPWGKRDDDDSARMQEKRKWSQFNSWGKKRENMDPQSKWSQFSAWGKRSDGAYPEPAQIYSDENPGVPVDKRRWNQFASWGKRLRNAKTWAALNSWGKRRWSGLVTWGKRSGDMTEPNTSEIAQKFLQFFDANDDGTLDITEIESYLETLSSLPSSKDVVKQQDGLEM